MSLKPALLPAFLHFNNSLITIGQLTFIAYLNSHYCQSPTHTNYSPVSKPASILPNMNTPHIEAERAVEDNHDDGHPPVQPHGPSQVHSPHGPERDQAAADSLPASDNAVVPESSGAAAACVNCKNKEQQYRPENASTLPRPLEKISITLEKDLGKHVGISVDYQPICGSGQIEVRLYPIEQASAQANAQHSHSETPSINEPLRSHEAATSENAESGNPQKPCGKGKNEAQPDCYEDSDPSSLHLQPEVEALEADVASERTSNATPYIKSITIEQIPCSEYSARSRMTEHIPCPQHGGR